MAMRVLHSARRIIIFIFSTFCLKRASENLSTSAAAPMLMSLWRQAQGGHYESSFQRQIRKAHANLPNYLQRNCTALLHHFVHMTKRHAKRIPLQFVGVEKSLELLCKWKMPLQWCYWFKPFQSSKISFSRQVYETIFMGLLQWASYVNAASGPWFRNVIETLKIYNLWHKSQSPAHLKRQAPASAPCLWLASCITLDAHMSMPLNDANPGHQ